MDPRSELSPSRRAFLAAGAALSVGILGTPAPGLGASMAWGMMPPTLDRIRAILTTPRAHYGPSCDCPHCRAVQATRYDCRTCGYAGPPATWPYSCAWEARQQLVFVQTWLQANRGKRWPAEWKTSRAALRRERRAMEELFLAHDVGLCDGFGKGQPEVAALLFSFEGNCLHTERKCPLCDYSDGDSGPAEASELFAILRDLNACVRGEV